MKVILHPSAFILLFALATAATAQDRTLHWKSLDVTATIDRDGLMAVSERHTMVFDGAWNGGERNFRVEPGQVFQFNGISRVDPSTGEATPLTAAVGTVGLHEYLLDGTTLRWRARRASDPPFHDDELTYVIDYVLMNVIAKEGEGYDLEHDFAFADRTGPIEKYTLHLQFDPAWKLPADFATRIERSMIPPGESLIVDIPLGWAGEGQPAYLGVPAALQATEPTSVPVPVPVPMPIPIRIGALAVFFLIVLGLRIWFVKREEGVGRYDPPPHVDRQWIETTLMNLEPEVVGEAWDGTTGQAEVSALIARLTMEKKIENVPGKEPRLRLLVPRESFQGYELELVNALFVRGDEITPSWLRVHYLSTGFDPARSISSSLSNAAETIVGRSKLLSGCASVFVGSVLIAVLAPGGAPKLAGVVAFLFSVGLAAVYRDQLGQRTAASFLPIPLALFGIVVAMFATSEIGLLLALLATLFLTNIVLYVGAWTAGADRLKMLLSLRAAREWFKSLLDRKENIEERWVPYILGFGLGQELDQWAVKPPVQRSERIDSPRDDRRIVSSSSSSAPSAPSAPAFQPGGGAFGGAGATGGWSKSVATFAAAVPKPSPPRSSGSSSSSSWSSSSSSSSRSSSSSSGSRSSGGSRSGGGGGGGW